MSWFLLCFLERQWVGNYFADHSVLMVLFPLKLIINTSAEMCKGARLYFASYCMGVHAHVAQFNISRELKMTGFVYTFR